MTPTSSVRAEQFTGVERLSVRNEHGDITLRCIASDGLTHVRVTAGGDVALEPITMTHTGSHLDIDVPGLLDADTTGRGFSFQLGPISFSSGTTKVDIEIELPHDTDIKATTKSGDITVSGEAGDVTAKTGSGGITLEQAKTLQLKTGSGDVAVRTCTGGIAATGSGDVSIHDVTGTELQCVAGSGDISLRHTRLERLTATTGSGDISLHLAAGSFEAKSGTGTIDVTIPRDTPAWLDLSSGTGTVSKDIDSVGPHAEGQPHLTIKARTGVGNIRIQH